MKTYIVTYQAVLTLTASSSLDALNKLAASGFSISVAPSITLEDDVIQITLLNPDEDSSISRSTSPTDTVISSASLISDDENDDENDDDSCDSECSCEENDSSVTHELTLKNKIAHRVKLLIDLI